MTAWLASGATSAGTPASIFYPQGKTLLFTTYSVHEPELSRARSEGFTAIGPFYGRDIPRTLNYASIAKLPAIHSVGPKLDFNNDGQPDEAVFASIAEEVRTLASNDSIAIWNIHNEELRYWRKAEMHWLERVSGIIKANDPLQRPVMMYEPNHRNAAALNITGQYLDLVTKGSYTNYVGMKTKRTWLRWSIDQSTASAAKTGNTPIAVLWMARDQKTAEEIAAIPRWVRHDVYLSLISGAKGVIVFSAYNRRKGFSKHFKNFYEAYAKAANELNGELDLGGVFLFGSPQTGASFRYLSGPEQQSFDYNKKPHTYPTVHFLHSRHDGTDYLFVVNSANEPVSIKFSGLNSPTYVQDAFSISAESLSDPIRLNTHEVKGYRWKRE
jgi:hypothetical protein